MTKDPERAEKLRRGKLLLKLRDTLIHIKMDDEGDRVYLRSTNDADQLKEIIAEIDDYGWQEFMREKGDPDINIFEECRKANSEIATLTTSLAAAEARGKRLEEALRSLISYASGQALSQFEDYAGTRDKYREPEDIVEARSALSQTEEGR